MHSLVKNNMKSITFTACNYAFSIIMMKNIIISRGEIEIAFLKCKIKHWDFMLHYMHISLHKYRWWKQSFLIVSDGNHFFLEKCLCWQARVDHKITLAHALNMGVTNAILSAGNSECTTTKTHFQLVDFLLCQSEKLNDLHCW